MKGNSTHETDTWNIARRRSCISNDALDARDARSGNSVGHIFAKGAFEFLRSLQAAALYLRSPSRSRIIGSARSRTGIFRACARAKYIESRGSRKRKAADVLVRLVSKLFVQ